MGSKAVNKGMMLLLQQIASRSTGHTFHRQIRSNPELEKWVLEQTQELNTDSISERGYYLLHGRPECPQGNQRRFLTFTRGYGYCARAEECQCQQEIAGETSKQKWATKTDQEMEQVTRKRVQTNLSRYGVANAGQTPQAIRSRQDTYQDPQRVKLIGERIRETKTEKYGDPNWVNSPKRRSTCLERYGVEEHLQRPEVWDQIRETNRERYGVDYPPQSPEVREKQLKAMRKRASGLGVNWPNQKHISSDSWAKLNDSEWIRHQHHSLNLPFSHIAAELGVSPAMLGNYARNHGIEVKLSLRSDSLMHKLLIEWLSSTVDSRVDTNVRTLISPKEIDIYLPEHRLAIEVNGSYWHSQLSGRKTRNYHLDKTLACQERGIRLIHIWEHDWNRVPELICSRLSYHLGVTPNKLSARKCELVKLPKSQANQFLDKNHLKGSTKSSVELGLMYGDRLVSVMTLGRARYTSTAEYELLRYCSLADTAVAGGAGKLFTGFCRMYQPSSVVSYADRQWGDGDFYSRLGFELTGFSAPGYSYTSDYQNFHSRSKFQKHRLATMLPDYDASLSEWKNMQMNGYDRIWDCGNAVYVWRNS